MAKFLTSSGLEYFTSDFLEGLLTVTVQKREGYGLSKNDFTDDLKNKLDNIEAKANHYEHPESMSEIEDVETYRSVTVDKYGHVVNGSNPTNLRDYGITEVNASLIKGTIPMECIPAGAIETLVHVPNKEAMYKLTVENVQLGDTVKVESENGQLYMVIDESQLNNQNGYQTYSTGKAASVDWTGVENRPDSLKNPHPLNIKLDGRVIGTYDGSTASDINIESSALSVEALTNEEISAIVQNAFNSVGATTPEAEAGV